MTLAMMCLAGRIAGARSRRIREKRRERPLPMTIQELSRCMKSLAAKAATIDAIR
jgi:hypothetical protein